MFDGECSQGCISHKRTRDLGFELKALQCPPVEGDNQWEHLEGDPSPDRYLIGLVNQPHPAPTDFADNSEIAEHFPTLAGPVARRRLHESVVDLFVEHGQSAQGRDQLAELLGPLWMLGDKSININQLAREHLSRHFLGEPGQARVDVYRAQ